ncbi:probable calcium-binding protein CML48 [Triticum dicoccoides]|uniref:probable calcium-binding protein CML48 n=1 Tax=Triticum dicoccoides TaxID=85692 RepID=UPI000E7AA8B5|nr:probable calcium-binding protein CML48 [Triticum dicoccoides]
MADYNRYGHGHDQGYGQGYGYAPSAPPAPTSSPYGNGQGYSQGYVASAPPAPTPSSSSSSPYGYGYGQGGYPPPMGGFGGAVAFPPGTHPDVERAFRAVDRDGSGSIDEGELQAALSDAHHRFSIRTVRLLIFLFSNAQLASSPRSRMGPTEFVTLWNCLGQWRVVFDRYDRGRSGKIDSDELREALRSLGYAVPPSVIDLLIANYNNGVSHRGALDFDNFVECGMVVKGLTEKFKENDTRYTGSAALTYDGFLSMVIPFIVP